MRSVTITIECEITLTERQIWPEGPVPEGWTVDDVVRELEEYSPGKRRTLEEWSLADIDEYTVTVTGQNPHAGQLDSSGHEEPQHITREVWKQ